MARITIASLAATVSTIITDVAGHAAKLGAHRAELDALKREVAELKAAQPHRAPSAPIVVRDTPSVRLEHAVLFTKDCAFKYRAGCAAKYPQRVWCVAKHHTGRGWLITSRAK